MSRVTAAASRLAAHVGWWAALRRPGVKRILGFNSLIDAAGSGTAAVCLPFFALLVAHLTPVRFALVLAAGGVAELVMAVPNGALAGRFGVFRVSLLTRVGRAVGYCAFAFTTSFPFLLALSVLLGVMRAGGGGLNQSLTASIVGEDRQSTLAVTRALRNVGYLASSGLAALLIAANSPVFLRIALVLNGLSFLLSAWLIWRVRPSNGAELKKERLDWSVLSDLRYLGLIVAASVFASSVLVLDVALPLWVLRHREAPRPLVAAVLALNTVVVVVMQYRFSTYSKTVSGALCSIRLSAVAFSLMAVVFAFAAGLGRWPVIVSILVIGLLLTFGEMLESPAWWTLSFELAPKDRSDEYLAAFDLCFAVLNIAGPPAVVLVVEQGSAGWFGYLAAIVAATVYVHAVLARARSRELVGEQA